MARWHSLHIHYYDPQDALLVDAIAPLVHSERGPCPSRWFFLRYWKQGPHIRLRLFLDDSTADGFLHTAQTTLREYLAIHPSTNAPPDARLKEILETIAGLEGGQPQTQELLPDNTLRFDRYEPEYEKYGGEIGVALAEDLFERSSELTLDLLSLIHGKPGQRFAVSFNMMLNGLRGAGLNEAGIADFLATYSRFWSRYSSQLVNVDWQADFDERKRKLSASAAAILLDRLPTESPTGAALARWREIIRNATQALESKADEILPNVTMAGPNLTTAQRREFVWFNYLHTHNNRLGVMPAQEAYLAYLAHHVVCDLAGFKPQPIP
ncbi:MAG TPA: thiopeptide-type bacteriocin biosynthesis protein [Pyrinomonadaceae bacterium]|nr:thiopeptide-type bacteriocin biosynthesis protein [Pyrinomonadaceae bacterium]